MRLNVLTDNSRWIAFQNTPEPYQWHWTVDILSMFEIRMLLNWHFPTTDSVRSSFVIKNCLRTIFKVRQPDYFFTIFITIGLYRHTARWTKWNNNCKYAKWNNKNLEPLENKIFVIAIHRNQSFGNNIYTRNTSSI